MTLTYGTAVDGDKHTTPTHLPLLELLYGGDDWRSLFCGVSRCLRERHP